MNRSCVMSDRVRRRRWPLAVTVMFALVWAPASAGAKRVGAELVKDINPGMGGSYPVELTAAGETLLFVANDGVAGSEVWKSTGTPRGTTLVNDLVPGIGAPWDDVVNLFAVGTTGFFVANASSAGRELWKTDGTDAGTVLVEDIRPGPESPFLQGSAQRVRAGDTLLFTADDGMHGWELWRSQPPYTASTTSLVEDIRPGTDFGVFVLDGSSAAVGDTLFFTANDGNHGWELWKSEPPYTESTTSLVKDIDLLPNRSSFPQRLTAVGDTVFFIAHDGVTGWELWKSDGTEAGTVLVEDIEPLVLESSLPGELTAVGNTLFFVTEQTSSPELWKSEPPFTDGTTSRVKPILLRADRAIESLELTAVGNTLYFHPDHDAYGRELWKSDGTEAGTFLVKDIRPGAGDSMPFDVGHRLTAVGDTLFFLAEDFVHGLELWRSDGTDAGTVLVEDIEPGPAGVGLVWAAAIGTTFFFSPFNSTVGTELWKAEGRSTGPRR